MHKLHILWSPMCVGAFLCRPLAGPMAKASTECCAAFFLLGSSGITGMGTTGHVLKAIFTAAEENDLAVIRVDEVKKPCPTRIVSDCDASCSKNFLERIDGVRGPSSVIPFFRSIPADRIREFVDPLHAIHCQVIARFLPLFPQVDHIISKI